MAEWAKLTDKDLAVVYSAMGRRMARTNRPNQETLLTATALHDWALTNRGLRLVF